MNIRPIRPPRAPRKRRRSQNPEVRGRLMGAASDLIREQGFPQLRVEDVAVRAGLSVGTFYLYFDGKDDLFANLAIEHTCKLRSQVRAAYRSRGPVDARLSRGLDAYLDFVSQNERVFLYFRDSATVHTTVGKLSTWAIQQLADELRPVLEEAMRTGYVRGQDPELSAQAILGQIQHMAGFWLEHRDSYSRETIKGFLSRLIYQGLGKPLETADDPQEASPTPTTTPRLEKGGEVPIEDEGSGDRAEAEDLSPDESQ